MKSLVGKFGTLALLTAVAGSMVVACSSTSVDKTEQAANDGSEGSIGLNLVPVSGITINSVNYVVTGTPAIAGTALPSGVLPTPGTADNFSFGIPVPVGSGYTLSLTAASAEPGDNITCTGSFGPFDVAPNASSNFTLTLTCVDNSNGQLVATVDVETDACPRLIPDYVSAIPSTATLGSSIAVNSLGHDLDGKPVSYGWSIPAAQSAVGSFVAPGAAATSFSCVGAADDVVVTVTMDNGECTKTLSTLVSCTSLDCPDGELDAGEDCDPNAAVGTPGYNAFGCPSDCTVDCGDGNAEAPTEQCEPPSGQTESGDCTATCRNRDIACGDGWLTTGEPCDGTLLPAGTPAGSTCNATCTAVIPPAAVVCGDSTVGGTEQCDPGSAGGVTTGNDTCSDSCQSVATAACVDCEQNGPCFEFSTSCIDNAATPADRTACFDVQECIVQSGCGDSPRELTSCYCGNRSTPACQAATPEEVLADANAPCALAIRNAMGAGSHADGKPTNLQVLERYLTTSFAGGAAIARYNCVKGSAVCRPVCGF